MAYPSSPTNGQIFGNKKYNSTKGVWENCLQLPIGFIYTQYPGKQAPADAFGGTWTDVTSTYAGAFFRAAGGNASAFGSGLQTGQNKSHSHTASSGTESADHTHSGSTGSMSANATHTHTTRSGAYGASGSNRYLPDNRIDGGTLGNSFSTEATNTDHTHSFSTGGRSAAHTHTITVNSDGGTEVRPDNYSVKIWERTA